MTRTPPLKPHYILLVIDTPGMPQHLFFSERWYTYIAAIFAKMHIFFGISPCADIITSFSLQPWNFPEIQNMNIQEIISQSAAIREAYSLIPYFLT